MVLKYYFDLMSQPSRAVWLFLKQNNIPHEECAVALRKGEHRTEEFAKINPFQRVPAIDHDGFKLSESIAIFRYLSSKFNVASHWYPTDPKLRARVDEFMSWQHLNLRLFGSMYFQNRIIGGKAFDDPKVQQFKGLLDGCLDQIEQIYLSQSPFINGFQDITIADLLAVCEMEQPIAAGYDIKKKRPIIAAYMDRVKACLPQQYEEAHKVARKVSGMVAQGKL